MATQANGVPMCRRIGCSGLTAGELGAVGTIGLLGRVENRLVLNYLFVMNVGD